MLIRQRRPGRTLLISGSNDAVSASPAPRRDRAEPATALDYQREALLRCPRCGAPAWSRVVANHDTSPFAPRRLVCGACAYVANWAEQSIRRADGACAIDDYFRLPLYLQTPCCGDVLWAYNPVHLDALGEWLRAYQRERRRYPRRGWSNQSFWSRLPRWIKQAGHRDDVQAALDRLDALAAPLR